MQPRDHLIVWRLDRIDRNPFRLIRAVEQLISRNITIHSLEEKGGLPLDLDTVQGRAMVMIWAIMADLFTQQLSESIRSAIAWRKANGLVYYGQPSYGRKRMRLPKRSGERKGRLVDVWDKKSWPRSVRSNAATTKAKPSSRSVPTSTTATIWCPIVSLLWVIDSIWQELMIKA